MSKKSFLNTLSNKALDEKLNQLVSGEREILTEIIIHIREVASRRMYLDFGHGSLFDYLTQRMGYANGSAQRRIDAARLSVDVPAVIDHIESGEINLSQISIMSQATRQVPRDIKVEKETKEQIIADLCEKTVAQSEVLVSKALNIPVKEVTKTKHQQDESIRLEITFTKEQWDKLTKAKELLSHVLPDGSGTIIKNRSHIPIRVQRQVLTRDRCCQYRSKITNQKCASTWKLEIDLIQPVWAGGGNEPENLRALCSAHNNKVYEEQAGIQSR